ncbi:MAG: hypothetical protein HYU28_01855 [Actinobacteria bacterium]|nr:hypothetical protein [Actinomycetota bacterium]
MGALTGIRLRLGSERGISVTEMMITLFVLTTVSVVFNNVLISSANTDVALRHESQTIDDLKEVGTQLEREFRWADYVLQPDGMFNVDPLPTSVSDDTLEFYTYPSNAIGHWVKYEIVAMPSDPTKGQIERSVAGGTPEVLADELVNYANAFTFYLPRVDEQAGYLDVHLEIQMDDRDPRIWDTRLTSRNLHYPFPCSDPAC